MSHLHERFQQPGLDDDVKGIPTNQFCAALFLWADGSFTRKNVVDSFQITNDEAIQLDRLIAVYVTKPTALLKLAYLLRIKNVLMLLEQGRVTIEQVKSILEL